MTSGQSPAAQQSPYAQSYQGGSGAATASTASGNSWNSTPAYTADQRSSAYGAADASPYAAPQGSAYGAAAATTPVNYQQNAQPATNYGADQGGYNQGGYTPGSTNQGGYNPGYSPAAAPSNYGQPQSYQAPAGASAYEGQHASAAEPSGYPNVGFPAAYNSTPAAPPAAAGTNSYRPALPASLAGESAGYRPGSTGRPVGGDTGTTASGSASYGNVYQR